MMQLTKAEFQVTSQCNMDCVFCFNNGHQEDSRLSDDIIFSQIEDAMDTGLQQVWITGGEPLLEFAGVIKIINFSKSRGLSVGLSTNGSLLSGHAKKLKDAGLDEVRISLDSSKKERFEQLRGGHFEKVLAGIQRAQESGLRTTIRLTLTRQNSDEVQSIINLSSRLGADLIEIKPVLPVGRGDLRFMLQPYDFYNAFLACKETAKKAGIEITCVCNYLPSCHGYEVTPNIPCQCSHSAIYIASDGEVMPCSYFPYENRFNAYRDRLSHVWQSDFFGQVRNLKPRECSNCASWDSCRNGCPAILHNRGLLGSGFFGHIKELQAGVNEK